MHAFEGWLRSISLRTTIGCQLSCPLKSRNTSHTASTGASMIVDPDINLKLGTSYLKLVLDDFGGSQAMAAAAYNAGPNRPRRWREGPRLESAIWVENVPFSETRDYVKKVLSNATFYAALLNNREATQAPSLKARLGATIGPREAGVPAPDAELP